MEIGIKKLIISIKAIMGVIVLAVCWKGSDYINWSEPYDPYELFSWIVLIVAIYSYKQRVSHTKKEQTKNLESIFTSKEIFGGKNKALRSLAKMGKNCFYCSLMRSDEVIESHPEIHYVLKNLEWYANGVYYKFYDEDYLFSSYSSHVITSFERTIPLILLRQGAQECAYIKFCWLASKWVLKRELDTERKEYKHLKQMNSKIEEYILFEYDSGIFTSLGKQLHKRLVFLRILKHKETSEILKDARHDLRQYYSCICTKDSKVNCWLKNENRDFEKERRKFKVIQIT